MMTISLRGSCIVLFNTRQIVDILISSRGAFESRSVERKMHEIRIVRGHKEMVNFLSENFCCDWKRGNGGRAQGK